MAHRDIFKIDDETGSETSEVIAVSAPADPSVAQAVIDAPAGGNEGRSEWMWFRLQNGDLILGTYPSGDTYWATEADKGRP